MNLVVEGEEGDNKTIFREHPHSKWDNGFNGDQIIYWLGGNEFGTTMAFMRYWFDNHNI